MSGRWQRTILALGCTTLLAAIGANLVLAQGADEDPKNIVAAQLRSQGYQCDAPQSATRDEAASRPNETVWILVCENATYRATLVPNMAAKVEVLNGKAESPAAAQ